MITHKGVRKMSERNEKPSPQLEGLAFDAIWDIARRLSAERENAAKPQERTIVLMGSKGAGKTQLIYHFLDRNDAPKPTLALEYFFGRKLNRNLTKDICHIWELGGGTVYTGLVQQLILTPLKSGRPVAAVIHLDLSAPKLLWNILEGLLVSLSKACKDFKRQNLEVYNTLLETKKVKVGSDHPDISCMDLLPIPLFILGGKYDIFKDFDPERKKIVCRSLRTVALVYGGGLYFYSEKDNGLIKRGKELMTHAGFDTGAPASIHQDYNAPLAIPVGADSQEQIGLGRASGPSSTLERAKHIFSSLFPQEMEELTELEDPAQNPSFREPVIDRLWSQKAEEMERMSKEYERKVVMIQDRQTKFVFK